MKKLILILLPFFALTNTCCSNAYAAERMGMRDERYCEVLLGFGGLLYPDRLDVYNTIGLNNCPDELWRNLNADKIQDENHAKVARLNGPRHWVIDGFKGSSLQDSTILSFADLSMRKAGILMLTLADVLTLGKPYKLHHVARKTTAVFLAGKPEFLLIDADGSVYFMQSYSQQKTDQSLITLAQLGSHLNLPAGWSYKVITLKNDFFLAAEKDMATVTQDEFENTYQLAPHVREGQF